MVEPRVGHGPDIGAAPHPGALRVELLDNAGHAATVGVEKPHPIADFEADLRIVEADRRRTISLWLPLKQLDPIRFGHLPHFP